MAVVGWVSLDNLRHEVWRGAEGYYRGCYASDLQQSQGNSSIEFIAWKSYETCPFTGAVKSGEDMEALILLDIQCEYGTDKVV